MFYLRFVYLALPVLAFAADTISPPQDKGPSLLTYDEIRALYETDQPPPALASKLNELLTTPFVNNQASARGVKPLKPSIPGLGASLILAQWNIERGLEFDAVKLAMSDPKGFSGLLEDRGSKIDNQERARVLAGKNVKTGGRNCP